MINMEWGLMNRNNMKTWALEEQTQEISAISKDLEILGISSEEDFLKNKVVEILTTFSKNFSPLQEINSDLIDLREDQT